LKNNQLNFDFDDVPFQSATPSKSVDRTSSAPSAPSAPAHTVTSNRHQPGGLLTADEVRSMGTEAKTEQPAKVTPAVNAQPVKEATVKKEVAAESTASSEYSSAALDIMRRMQKSQAETVKPAPEKTATPAQSEMGAFLSSRQTAPVTPKEVEKVAEPVVEAQLEKVVEAEPALVAEMRREKADAFKLDTDAMAAGFDSIDDQVEEATQEDMGGTSVFELPEEEGGTRMFDAVVPSSADKGDLGSSTIVIPDEFVLEEDDTAKAEIIEEYNSIEDAQSVSDDLIHRKNKLGIRFIGTAVIAALLIIITLSNNIFPFDHISYFIAVGILLATATVINLSTCGSLISVFTLKPDVDFAPAFAVLAAFIQTGVAAFFGTKGIASSGMLAAAAVVSLAFNTLSKRITVSRTLANFDLIANEEPKQAGAFIPAPTSASILDPKKHGETLILGRRTTVDMKGFIGYSLSPDLFEKLSGKLSLVIVIAALIGCIIPVIKGGSAALATTAFASVACLGAQIAASYPSAVLLNHICSKLRNNHVMLSGFKAAKEISDANVVVLDSDEIFNDECVSLFKFRTFGGLSPDVAFMTAAALTTEGHSPLAGMFNQIAATTGAGMLAADSVIYENSMGLTGWVDEKKTLLGNRMIMESHSIPVPSMEIDRKILKSGKFPLYLAIDDKIAAMFIIGYAADRQMLHRLRRLSNTGVTILVRTVDPNVTADLVCSAYGLHSDSVEVMASDASRYYCDKMSATEDEPALVCAEDARGFVDAYIASCSLQKNSAAASIAAIVMTCLVMALSLTLSALGIASAFSMVAVLASYAVVTAVTAVTALICS